MYIATGNASAPKTSVEECHVESESGRPGCGLSVVSLTACNSSNNNTVALSGAGSTFVNPAMSRWTADFSQAHANIHINYQSIGSGGGIQQVKAGTVDFGASDVALNDQQLAGMVSVVQIPESAGPVCIT